LGPLSFFLTSNEIYLDNAPIDIMQLKTVTLKQKVTFSATPLEVYNALTNPIKHTEFTGSKATGKAIEGGSFSAWDGYIFGKFLKLVIAKRIVMEWMTTEWPEEYPVSKVDIQLKVKGKGTEMLMVHTKVPAEQAQNYRQGWIDFYWKPLKEHFAESA
jgi:activator of HSP90 ATPase